MQELILLNKNVIISIPFAHDVINLVHCTIRLVYYLLGPFLVPRGYVAIGAPTCPSLRSHVIVLL